jgi:hypothetical protein
VGSGRLEEERREEGVAGVMSQPANSTAHDRQVVGTSTLIHHHPPVILYSNFFSRKAHIIFFRSPFSFS